MIRTLSATLLVLVGLVSTPAAPASAHVARTDRAVHTDRAELQKPPKYSAYEYRGTFTAEFKHHVQLEYYYEEDGRFIDASASLSGRIPSLTLTRRADGAIGLSIDSLRSTVRARSGQVDSTTVSDEGATEVRCEGDSIWRTDGFHPFLTSDSKGRRFFHPGGTLSLPQTCRDNQGSEPTESVHSLPELAAAMRMPPKKLGDKHITIPFSAERNFPRVAGQDRDCPDSAESLTKECTYTMTGTLELTRTRVYRPVAPNLTGVDRLG